MTASSKSRSDLTLSSRTLRRRLITTTTIGETNRRRVLETLHRLGPSSRAQLARSLAVNRATIATILQPLLESGTLVEGKPIAPSHAGGKPARPLWFRSDGPWLGAVQLSPDIVVAARIAFDGTIHEISRASYGRDASTETIAQALFEVTDRCLSGVDLVGIGVAAAGMVDTRAGRILSMHLTPGLNGLPVVSMLEERYRVSALVDHHPRVQALGDRWFGLGREIQDFASVYTGEALGFGIVHYGEVLRGLDGAGGESGHTIVQLDGELCRCGRRGCWETVATLGWLRDRAAALSLEDAESMDASSLAALASAGVTDASGLLDLYARNLAIGIANNEQILAPGHYIMHGDVCGGGELMHKALQGWVDRLAPERGSSPAVVFATEPDQITLLGGAGLVLSSAFSTRA
ncbi:ROK family transcriptional regulator [uncultured Microbacterium sp.]|uniref:ROK family transcriptional regulator n=1 Tax=uncultured Microbacterium sp. TaxID=191216 RepID=UPI002638BF9F|nr:ROK family protein [uncultured Microbacterium sp.]